MSSFKVKGDKELKGSIRVQGSKNEALQILASSIIAGDIVINNIPKINDVLSIINILQSAGATVTWLKDNDSSTEKTNKLQINTHNINKKYFESDSYFKECEKTRGSLLFMGPLLARFGKAYIPKTGGDKIGARPIDTHTLGFVALGAKLKKDKKGNYLTLKNIVKNKEILLEDASVTATANIIMCLTRGAEDITIYNAASETYIYQLCKVLKKCGMNIIGQGSNKILLENKADFDFKKPITIEHDILPDFIEVASFIALAMGTKSQITIKNAGIKYLGQTLNMFEKLGCKFKIIKDDIIVLKQQEYIIKKMYDNSIIKIYSQPWPNISPDILSVGIIASIQTSGVVIFNEKMYEARMFFVDKLISMGAQIVLCDPHRIVVTGINWQYKLKPRHLSSPDIRAGIALLIASLGAQGESVIENIEQIDRGYENIEKRLKLLGADIERID